MLIKTIKTFRAEKKEREYLERKQRVEEIVKELDRKYHIVHDTRFSMISDVMELGKLDSHEAAEWGKKISKELYGISD